MTKAEAYVGASDLWKQNFKHELPKKQRADGTEYSQQVYHRFLIDNENLWVGITHMLECDSYFGDSNLYALSTEGEWIFMKNVEYTYDTDLEDLV